MSWLPKKSVVVPVDLSPASENAVRTALEFVQNPSNVHVVHVAWIPDYIVYGDLPRAVDSELWLRQADQNVTKFVQELKCSGVTTKVLLGDPGLRITEYAAECHADLIVMPSHGYHGVKRILLGSVTERVLRHAACQVLVLRRPQ